MQQNPIPRENIPGTIATFMERVQLSGSEVGHFMACIEWLREQHITANSPQPVTDSQDADAGNKLEQ